VRRAGSIAQALTAAGLGRDDRVGVLLERGADAAAALFGITAAGGIAVLMDEGLRSMQIEHSLANAGAVWFITRLDLLARLPRAPECDARVLHVDDLTTGNGDFQPVQRAATAIAQVVYTSGSTGSPKGVMISHGNLRSLTAIVDAYLEISSSDRVASLLPLSFVYGLGQLLCAVSAGAALVVERSPLVTQIATTLRDQRVTVLAGVPSLWTRLTDTPGFRDEPIASLRVMTNAGGSLAPGIVKTIRESQPRGRLFLMYGLTEALRCTYLPPEEVDEHPDSIGRAIPGSEAMVIREDGSIAADDEVGELVFKGPTVTLGYWKDPVATERVFRPDPFPSSPHVHDRVVYTGDLVRRDEQGLMYFVGRKDRIIKTMGYRVAPHEVVAALHASSEVVDAEVVGEPHPQWGMVLVAHVVLRPGGSPARLREYCARELPRYMRPARFHTHDEMPLTPNGKHDLASLAGHATIGV
jgi:acyl-CoA synthetase (AMP-forming)/AMP-acid ligase II